MNKELKFTIPARGSQEFTFQTGVDQIAITNNDGVDGSITVVTSEITKQHSGDLVSFIDGADAPFADFTVNIAAVQSGSGDPSPTNVRPITGWTGATINVSDEDTSDPTTYNIDWKDEAGTVYGGTLDVLTGVLTVTHKHFQVSDYNWGLLSAEKHTFYIYSDVTDKQAGAVNVISNMYKTENVFPSNLNDYSICGRNEDSAIFVRDSRYSTVEDFKENGTNTHIIYELATPITYQLTPTEVRSLLGQNNIWADCGPVDVRYFVQSTQPMIDYIDEKTENVTRIFKATDNGGGVYTLDDITCDELCAYARDHSNIVLKVKRYSSAIAYDIFILSDYIGTSTVFRHSMITSSLAIGGGYVLYVRELQADSGTTTNVLTTRNVNITADT